MPVYKSAKVITMFPTERVTAKEDKSNKVDLLGLVKGNKVNQVASIFKLNKQNICINKIYISGVGLYSRKTTVLIEAIKKKSLNMAILLIDNGADINQQCDEKSPLRHAVEKDDLEMIKLLIVRGVKVNDYSFLRKETSKALETAVDSAKAEVSNLLLTKGAKMSDYFIKRKLEELNKHDKKKYDGLIEHKIFYIKQQYKNKFGELDPLLPHSCDNHRKDRFNPNNTIPALILAASQGGIDDVAVLLQEKVKDTANQTGPGGITALMCAAYSSKPNIELVKRLLNEGADPNLVDRYGYTALHWMNKKVNLDNKDEKIDIVKTLLQHGADPLTKDTLGTTRNKKKVFRTALQMSWKYPLICVVILKYINSEITATYTQECELQLEHGYVENYKMTGYTRLHVLATASDNSTNAALALMNELISQDNFDINATNEDGRTALMLACGSHHKNLKIVNFLLENGANIGAVDNTRRTAYHYAIDHGYTSISLRHNDKNGILALLKKHDTQKSDLRTMFSGISIVDGRLIDQAESQTPRRKVSVKHEKPS